MGNIASCTPYRWPAAASAPVVKVIDRDGCISVHEYSRGRRRQQQQQPMGPSTAAELMLDYPGLFVCDSSRLEVGCRISRLPADGELKPGHLYFLLPMNLLYSVLTEEEMVSFSCKPPSSKRRRIFPALSELFSIPPEAKKAVVEEEAEEQVSEAGRIDDGEVSRLRWWRPALDTIEEDQ